MASDQEQIAVKHFGWDPFYSPLPVHPGGGGRGENRPPSFSKLRHPQFIGPTMPAARTADYDPGFSCVSGFVGRGAESWNPVGPSISWGAGGSADVSLRRVVFGCVFK